MASSPSLDIGSLPVPEPCLQELKASSKPSHNLLTVVKNPSVGNLVSCGDYSSLRRLLRVTAYVVRAVSRFKAKGQSSSDSPVLLTPQEIAAAEMLRVMTA